MHKFLSILLKLKKFISTDQYPKTMNMGGATENHVQNSVYVRIRLAADKTDVPHIHKLIYQLAVFEEFTHLCEATEDSLSATLFNSPPFLSVTVFMLEVSKLPFPQDHHSKNPFHTPITSVVNLEAQIDDPDSRVFKSGENIVVAGHVIFFPNYPSFLAKQGFYIDNLFMREAYRNKGLGKMLLSAVATQAANMGYSRVDWICLDWNQNAIKFYEDMGAEVMPQWCICRLTGENLRAYGNKKINGAF